MLLSINALRSEVELKRFHEEVRNTAFPRLPILSEEAKQMC